MYLNIVKKITLLWKVISNPKQTNEWAIHNARHIHIAEYNNYTLQTGVAHNIKDVNQQLPINVYEHQK